MNDDFNLAITSFKNACEQLKLDQEVRDSIVDLSSTSNLSETESENIKKQCLLLIDLYKKLYAISGNDSGFIKHLLTTTNNQLDGKPIELIQTPLGLEKVVNYYSSISKS